MSEVEIFAEAREIEDAAERQAFLDRVCGADAGLKQRVMTYLRSIESAGDFLERPTLAAAESKGPTQTWLDRAEHRADELERHTLGDFRIGREIGRGGMGIVYEAEQISLGRRVALKALPYASMLGKTQLTRFKNEARAAASLHHPNVVHVHSVGSERGVHYYVMELIEGQTLDQLIAAFRKECGLEDSTATSLIDLQQTAPAANGSARRESTAVQGDDHGDTLLDHVAGTRSLHGAEERSRIQCVVQLGVQAAEALEHAHHMGIVHRDIKPSNLMVDAEQHLWVTDFGLAMVETQQNLTVSGSLFGTLRYMSPEQVRGDRHILDHHTDIYSLGCTLYEMLTLRKAFSDLDTTRLMQRISHDDPIRPRKLNRAISSDLETIVLTAMAKDHEDRYATAGDLAADLRRFLADQPIVARPPDIIDRTKKWARRHRTAVLTAGFTLLVAIMVAGILLWRQRSQTLKAYAAEQRQSRLAQQNAAEAQRQTMAADRARAAETRARQAAEHEAHSARESENFARQLVYAGDMRLAAQAWQDGDVRHYTHLLDQITRDARQLRAWEWYFLRQIGRVGYRSVAEDSEGTCCVRYSRDGRYLGIGQDDGSIRLLDPHSYRTLHVWRGHEGLINGMDFSPQGDRLASIGEDGTVCVWSLAEKRRLCTFQATQGVGFDVFFALDGNMLVSCGEEQEEQGQEVRLWEPATGRCVGSLTTDHGNLRGIAVSPDGKYCIAAASIVFQTWDLETRECTGATQLGYMRCLRMSPLGKLLAVAMEDQSIRLYRMETWEEVARFEGHDDDIDDLAFHPAGKLLASADRAGVIRTWPIDNRQMPAARNNRISLTTNEIRGSWPACFRAHLARARCVDFSPDGSQLLTGSKDGTVRSWSKRPPLLRRLSGTTRVRDLAFSDSGNLLLIARSDRVDSWDFRATAEQTLPIDIARENCSLTFTPNHAMVLCGGIDGGLRFWDRQKAHLVRTVMGHEGAINRVMYSSDGQLLLTSSWDGNAKLWKTGSYDRLATFQLPPHCQDAAFSPDGQSLAISSEDNAMLYDAASRSCRYTLQGHQNTAACLAFSPDSSLLATGSHDRTVRLWDIRLGTVRHVIPAHRNKIVAICFSPDGRTVVSGDMEGVLAFSHVTTGRFLYDLQIGDGPVRDLEFSPDATVLAAATGNDVVMLRIPSED